MTLGGILVEFAVEIVMYHWSREGIFYVRVAASFECGIFLRLHDANVIITVFGV